MTRENWRSENHVRMCGASESGCSYRWTQVKGRWWFVIWGVDGETWVKDVQLSTSNEDVRRQKFLSPIFGRVRSKRSIRIDVTQRTSILEPEKKSRSLSALSFKSFVAHLYFSFHTLFLSPGDYQKITIFTNPSARAGYDTRSIFKRSLTGLNSEFSFS